MSQQSAPALARPLPDTTIEATAATGATTKPTTGSATGSAIGSMAAVPFWDTYPIMTYAEAVETAKDGQASDLVAARQHGADPIEITRLDTSCAGLQAAQLDYKANPKIQLPATTPVSYDELCAVRLYTLEAPKFYFYLNRALRERNQAALEHWKPLARLLLSGLSKLPSHVYPVLYRGVDRDLAGAYKVDSQFFEILSASIDDSFVNNPATSFFRAETVTVLRIENAEAVSLRNYSSVPENEVVILPGAKFAVKDSLTLKRYNRRITYMNIVIKHESPSSSLDIRAYNMLGNCVDAYSFWRDDNDFQEQIGIETLLAALDYFAIHHNITTPSALVSDNPKLTEQLSPRGSELVCLQRFATFLYGATSLSQALSRFLVRNGNAGPDLRALLAPVPCGEDLARLRQAYLPGTCEWVFTELENWANLDNTHENARVFWIQGVAGMGKSVIAQQIVARYGFPDDVEVNVTRRSQEALNVVGYFFCKHYSDERNNPRRVVATLAYRLTCTLPAYRTEVDQLLAADATKITKALCGQGTLPDLFDVLIVRPLHAALLNAKLTRDVFLLVDALDELRAGTNRQDLLHLLNRKLPTLSKRVRFIITSRPDEDVVRTLTALQAFPLSKDEQQHLNDVQLYVREKFLASTEGLQSLEPEQVEELTNIIVKQSEGVFLAVKLMWDFLQSCKISSSWTPLLAKARLLTSQGRFIDEFFLENMERVLQQSITYADDSDKFRCLASLKEILQILVAAKEPLRTCDVHEVLGTGNGKAVKAILRGLSTFFYIESAHSRIVPIHKTVFDFLTEQNRAGEKFFVEARQGHALLAVATLNALAQRGMLAKEQFKLLEPNQNQVQEKFVQYALRYGHVHLRDCILELIKRRECTSCEQAVRAWSRRFIKERELGDQRRLSDSCPRGYSVTKQEATTDFAAWLLLQAYSSGEQRRSAALEELFGLERACNDWVEMSRMTTPDSNYMIALWRSFARAYGNYWASWSRRETLDVKAATFVQELPLESMLFASDASRWLVQVTSANPALLVVPRRIGFDNCAAVLQGHRGGVCSVAFNADGGKIVSGGWDRKVRVWDAMSGASLIVPTEAFSTIRSVAVTAESAVTAVSAAVGARIVTGSFDGVVRLWGMVNGEFLRSLKAHSDEVLSVAITADGRRIVSGSSDKTAKVWNGFDGAHIRTLVGHREAVHAVALNADGGRVISGSADCTICVWDTMAGTCLRTLAGHRDAVFSVAVDSTGARIVSGSADKTVCVWDSEKAALLHTLNGHSHGVCSVAISGDGNRIASGGDDEVVRLWDVEKGTCLKVLEGHSDSVRSVALSGNGSRIVSGSDDNTVRIWETTLETCVLAPGTPTSYVYSVAVSADGNKIVSGGFDNAVRVWDGMTGECLKTMEAHNDSVLSVVLSADCRRIVSGSWDTTVRIWDVASGDCWKSLEEHNQRVTSVALRGDDAWIVSGSWDRTLRVWDVISGTCLRTLRGHEDSVNSVAVSSDGLKIVSGGEDNTVRVWDVRSEASSLPLAGHSGRVTSVVLSADGGKVVSGSYDNTVKVWDLRSLQCVKTFEGRRRRQYVKAVAISGDGTTVVCAADKTVRVWDVEQGLCVQALRGHSDDVRSIALTGDGRRIVSGSEDKTIRVWKV